MFFIQKKTKNKNINMITELIKNIPGIYEIRPKVLLKSVEDIYNSPIDLSMYLPSSDIGSLTMLEATMIISLLKIYNPLEIFEFGTFLGFTTALLVKNSSVNSTVYSLDLDNSSNQKNFDFTKLSDKDILGNDLINDAFLSNIQFLKGEFFLRNINDSEKKKIKLLKENSLELDIHQLGLFNKIEFCFIDGGHTYDIIKSDTDKAFSMSKKNSLIIWHDYKSKIHGDVTLYLSVLSKKYEIFHIANTMLAFTIVK
jgi:hypothetical protein